MTNQFSDKYFVFGNSSQHAAQIKILQFSLSKRINFHWVEKKINAKIICKRCLKNFKTYFLFSFTLTFIRCAYKKVKNHW